MDSYGRGTVLALVREHYNNREAWLNGRKSGIGASEISAVFGICPWLATTELWEIKCGFRKPKDVSANSAVQKGVRLEPILRSLYSTLHPDYKIQHFPYDILYQESAPFIRATLDGEIITPDHKRGVLEIKTATLQKKSDWEKWNFAIPDYYAAQIYAQLAATQWDFVDVFACLFNGEDDMTIRTYRFWMEESLPSVKVVIEEAKEFWSRVQKKQFPKVTLNL